MRAGELRHRVTLLAPPDPSTTDDAGQPTDDWSVAGHCWADVRDLTGMSARRIWAAQQIHAGVQCEVRMRWTMVVTEGMRIQHGSRLLEILGIPADPDGRRRELVCLCREVKP